MAEQTQVETPVSQAAPTDEQRMAVFLEQHDRESGDPNVTVSGKSEAPRAIEAEQPKEPASSEELTPDDLPDEVEAKKDDDASEVDEFEIVHDGAPVKLTRAKTIELARQGFDYTKKTQDIAEVARQLTERLTRVQSMEQIQPLLAQEAAQVSALEAQLKPYQSVDWVQIATDDPIGYSKYRAQYDVLLNNWQGAVHRRNEKSQAIAQEKRAIDEQHLRQEGKRLLELIPEWKDTEKRSSGEKELRSYLRDLGATDQAIDGLRDALSIAVIHKASRYDKLLKTKTEKVKQLRTAPPVTRPSSSQSTTKVDEQRDAMQRLRKTGSDEDAAAAILNRWK